MNKKRGNILRGKHAVIVHQHGDVLLDTNSHFSIAIRSFHQALIALVIFERLVDKNRASTFHSLQQFSFHERFIVIRIDGANLSILEAVGPFGVASGNLGLQRSRVAACFVNLESWNGLSEGKQHNQMSQDQSIL